MRVLTLDRQSSARRDVRSSLESELSGRLGKGEKLLAAVARLDSVNLTTTRGANLSILQRGMRRSTDEKFDCWFLNIEKILGCSRRSLEVWQSGQGDLVKSYSSEIGASSFVQHARLLQIKTTHHVQYSVFLNCSGRGT